MPDFSTIFGKQKPCDGVKNISRIFLERGRQIANFLGLLAGFVIGVVNIALAEETPEQNIAMLWSLYVDTCDSLLEDIDVFIAGLARFDKEAAYVVNLREEGAVVQLSIAWPEMSFSYDAGVTGGKTFMSCGVYTQSTGPSLEAFVNAYESEIIKRSGDGLIVGGNTPTHEVYQNPDGGFDHVIDEGNYFYYTSGVLKNVDTVTFTQLADGYVSLYFHHIFEGKVGVPSNPQELIVHIP